MTRITSLTLGAIVLCTATAQADYWPCTPRYASPVYYPAYTIDPCLPTTAAKPVPAAKPEAAPSPRSTPRTSPAHVPATGPAAPAASPSRLGSNFSRDYAPEATPAAPPPPAPGIEPSSPPRRPSISESIERKYYYDAYFVPGDDAAAARPQRAGERSVCFWNLSANRLTLQVAGRPYVLERGKQLSLDLPANFTWQIGDRPAEETTLGEAQTAMEIVIRK